MESLKNTQWYESSSLTYKYYLMVISWNFYIILLLFDIVY